MKRFLKSLSVVLVAVITAVSFSSASTADIFENDVFAKSRTDRPVSELPASSVKVTNFTDARKTAMLNIFDFNLKKESKNDESKRRYVGIGGDVFGIKLYTKGVMVIGVDFVTTDSGNVSPCAIAGVENGDIITHVNGSKVKSASQLIGAVENSGGESLKLKVERNGKTFELALKPELSTNGKFKAGLWVRDSSAGIGTVTFYDDKAGYFAGLGHGIYDVDTGKIMPLSNGEALKATVNGFYKSSAGNPGELCGVFGETVLGSLRVNGDAGVISTLNASSGAELVPVARADEVKEGAAVMVATIDENGPQHYDVQIIKVYSSKDDSNRNMIVEITDEELLEKTGGILQGMSGAPLLKDGMLIGAVTHVFVNNPTQGYAIFAENMVQAAAETLLEKAS